MWSRRDDVCDVSDELKCHAARQRHDEVTADSPTEHVKYRLKLQPSEFSGHHAMHAERSLHAADEEEQV